MKYDVRDGEKVFCNEGSQDVHEGSQAAVFLEIFRPKWKKN